MPISTDANALAFIRAQIGDTDTNDEYLTDTEIDYLYDNYADSDVQKTIAWALDQMCAKAFRKVSRTDPNTGDNVQAVQEREALCEQAKKWARRTGILSNAVTTGELSLGIDEEDTEVSNP